MILMGPMLLSLLTMCVCVCVRIDGEWRKMLDYENQLFLEILNEDALVVAAEGLALERVLVNLLKGKRFGGKNTTNAGVV